jgi:hypothetical protein
MLVHEPRFADQGPSAPFSAEPHSHPMVGQGSTVASFRRCSRLAMWMGGGKPSGSSGAPQ